MFSKSIRPMCLYCFYTNFVYEDGSTCLCDKKGVVPFDFSCRKYMYDPTKRIPPRSKPFKASGFDLDINKDI